MQPLLAWHCAGDSIQEEVTKWPEEVGNSREGIPGEVTAGPTALEPQHSECFGSWGQSVRRDGEAPRASERAQDFEPGPSQGPLTVGYHCTQLINKAGIQVSSRAGPGTRSPTCLSALS